MTDLNAVWDMPSKEEHQDIKAVQADDYIIKLGKITLEMASVWDNAKNAFSTTHRELKYNVICLPYQRKAEPGIQDIGGQEVAPLSQWIWRQINPFSTGHNLQGEPSFLRGLIVYAMGQTDDDTVPLRMPGAVILDKNGLLASDIDQELYTKQIQELRNGTLAKSDPLLLSRQGFKHIPDIRTLEGKYVGARVILKKDKNGNDKPTITGFSKLPSTFKPDLTLESEAMTKFAESHNKMLKSRAEKGYHTPTLEEYTATNRATTISATDISSDDQIDW